jgi:hypothetical protein
MALSDEQMTSLDELVNDTILNAIVEDCHIKHGGKKFNKALKFIIKQLKKELCS